LLMKVTRTTQYELHNVLDPKQFLLQLH